MPGGESPRRRAPGLSSYQFKIVHMLVVDKFCSIIKRSRTTSG